jgi:hypothetical protein
MEVLILQILRNQTQTLIKQIQEYKYNLSIKSLMLVNMIIQGIKIPNQKRSTIKMIKIK